MKRRFVAMGLAVGVSWANLFAEEVARVNDHVLRVAEVREQILRSGLDVYAPESATHAVGDLIANALLAAEARLVGLDRDPEVRAQIDRLLIDRLLADRVEEKLAEYQPDAAEIAAWQRSHPDQVHHPATARVTLLSLWLPQGRTNVEPARLALIADALSAGTNLTQLASRLSDDPMDRSGQPVVFVEGRPSRRYPDELASVVFGLTNRGVVAGPVMTSRTAYFVSLVDRRERQPIAADQAKRVATRALVDEKRRLLRETVVDELRAKATVVVHTNRLGNALEKPDGRPPRGPLTTP